MRAIVRMTTGSVGKRSVLLLKSFSYKRKALLSLLGSIAVKNVIIVMTGTKAISFVLSDEEAASLALMLIRILILHITKLVHTNTTIGSSLCKNAPDFIILVI